MRTTRLLPVSEWFSFMNEVLIKELQDILRDDYGLAVEHSEASEIARSLIGFFDLLGEANHRDHSAALPQSVELCGSAAR